MFEQSAVQSLATLIAMIFLGLGLRKTRLLKEEHGGLFAKIIVNVTVPALVFSALSSTEFKTGQLMLAVVLIISQLGCALIALILSHLLMISRTKKGALLLASTFPSSAFLGYAVVKEIYKNNEVALADAVITSELGVATLLFTLGVYMAMHFGAKHKDKGTCKTMISFLYSPIFISMILGISVSFLPVPKGNVIVEGFYQALHLISSANTFLVALTIGVMLYFKNLRHVWIIVLIAVVVKLIVQPLIAHSQALLFNFPPLWHQIVVLEASMPTAALTAVFAKRFGCDSGLISILIFASFISSCVTMIMMFVLLNG